MTPRWAWVKGLRCVSRAYRHDHRCQTKSAVQRWQEVRLHETGVVSRVPRSARRAQALETDSNTDQNGSSHQAGSFATQADRGRILDLIANQLHELGYRDMRATSLKPKHVEALTERWKADSLSPGTIKNRMTTLRWWAEKIGKQNVVALVSCRGTRSAADPPKVPRHTRAARITTLPPRRGSCARPRSRIRESWSSRSCPRSRAG